MKRREKILAISLLAAVMAWWGVPLLGGLIFGPINDRWSQIKSLESQQQKLDDGMARVVQTMSHMRAWRERSLPPEPLEAQGLYMEWLTELARRADIRALHVIPEQREGGGPAGRTVIVTLKGEATFDQLLRFLHDFERTDLLHRIATLKVDGPKTPGRPLTFAITVEGLCMQNAQPRDRLLAQTQLVSSLPRSFDTLKVVSAADFPKEPGFDVRIQNEILTVTKVSGNDWTVKHAQEGTTAERHSAKVDVELFPVRADRRKLSLEDRKKQLAVHPFLKPGGPDADDPARQTKLMASVSSEDEHVAWLYNALTRSRTEVRKGTEISVGEIKGTVVSVEPNCIQIDRNGAVWQVNLGRDLRSMRRVGDEGFDDGGFSDFSMDPSGSSDGPRGGRGSRGPSGSPGPGGSRGFRGDRGRGGGRDRFGGSRGRGPGTEGGP